MDGQRDEFAISVDQLAAMDDSALISWRTRVREELERLPPHSLERAKLSARYEASTMEIDERAREAWGRVQSNGSLGENDLGYRTE